MPMPFSGTKQNLIIMVSGKQGVGKTMVMTAMGFMEYLRGTKIYANYHLNYDYTPVTSMDDMFQMKNGLFLADELWRWLQSRRSMRKDQLEILSDVVENLRKRNMDMIFSTHHPMHIDTMVRRVTTHYIIPKIIPLVVPDNDLLSQFIDDKEELKDAYIAVKDIISHPENYAVHVTIYDEMDYPIRTFMLENLEFWGSMYDTRQEIGQLNKEKKESNRPGVKRERELEKALLRRLPEKYVYRIPNSGDKSPYPGDLIVQRNLIDVKEIYKGDYIDLRSRKWQDYFDCEKIFGLKPWLAVKNGQWIFIPVTPDSEIIKNQSKISVSKLKQNAIKLKEFCTNLISVGRSNG